MYLSYLILFYLLMFCQILKYSVVYLGHEADTGALARMCLYVYIYVCVCVCLCVCV